MPASFNKFQVFAGNIGLATMNLNTDVIKDALFSGAPAATDTAYNGTGHTMTGSSAAEVVAGNGYTAGGNAMVSSSYAQSGGTGTLTVTDPAIWTATGGTIGPFRYIVAYDATAGGPTTRPPIGFWDYGANLLLLTGETFQITHNGSILTIS